MSSKTRSSLLGSRSSGNGADDLADPRGWEVRTPPRLYGSAPESRPTRYLFDGEQEHDQDYGYARTEDDAGLPLFDEKMETRQRRAAALGEKMDGYDGAAALREKQMLEDDSGKWGKGHGAGPGVGGRRGLPPRQRIPGWKGVYIEWEDWIWCAVYTALSMLTRYWNIGKADYVVWDEVGFAHWHLGKADNAGPLWQVWLALP